MNILHTCYLSRNRVSHKVPRWQWGQHFECASDGHTYVEENLEECHLKQKW